MKTNHLILEAPLQSSFAKNIRRKAMLQTSLLLVAAMTIVGSLLAITSCQSPVEIATPRTSTPDITWAPPQAGQTTAKVASVNGVEPEAEFSLTHYSVVRGPNVQTTASVETAWSQVVFKDPASHTYKVNINTNGLTPHTYGLTFFSLYEKGSAFFNTSPLNMSDINTTTPLTFDTQGYTLSDNKINLLGRVEITSHKNADDSGPTIIQRGQTLTLRWVSEAMDADGAQVTLTGWPSSVPTGTGNTTATATVEFNQPIQVKKSIPVTGVSEVQFTSDEINKFPAGMQVSLDVKYYKAKTANNGKAVLMSYSESFVTAMMK
jgi:hypothetical protein